MTKTKDILKKAGKGLFTLGAIAALNLIPAKANATESYKQDLIGKGYDIVQVVMGDSINEKDYPQVKDDNLLVIGYSPICYNEQNADEEASRDALDRFSKISGSKKATRQKDISNEIYVVQKDGRYYGYNKIVSFSLGTLDKEKQKELIDKYGKKKLEAVVVADAKSTESNNNSGDVEKSTVTSLENIAKGTDSASVKKSTSTEFDAAGEYADLLRKESEKIKAQVAEGYKQFSGLVTKQIKNAFGTEQYSEIEKALQLYGEVGKIAEVDNSDEIRIVREGMENEKELVSKARKIGHQINDLLKNYSENKDKIKELRQEYYWLSQNTLSEVDNKNVDSFADIVRQLEENELAKIKENQRELAEKLMKQINLPKEKLQKAINDTKVSIYRKSNPAKFDVDIKAGQSGLLSKTECLNPSSNKTGILTVYAQGPSLDVNIYAEKYLFGMNKGFLALEDRIFMGKGKQTYECQDSAEIGNYFANKTSAVVGLARKVKGINIAAGAGYNFEKNKTETTDLQTGQRADYNEVYDTNLISKIMIDLGKNINLNYEHIMKSGKIYDNYLSAQSQPGKGVEHGLYVKINNKIANLTAGMTQQDYDSAANHSHTDTRSIGASKKIFGNFEIGGEYAESNSVIRESNTKSNCNIIKAGIRYRK